MNEYKGKRRKVIRVNAPNGTQLRGRLVGEVDGVYAVQFSDDLCAVPADLIDNEVCPKCNGTGFYCMGVINGKPYSRTGFDCHKCGGSGWLD